MFGERRRGARLVCRNNMKQARIGGWEDLTEWGAERSEGGAVHANAITRQQAAGKRKRRKWQFVPNQQIGGLFLGAGWPWPGHKRVCVWGGVGGGGGGGYKHRRKPDLFLCAQRRQSRCVWVIMGGGSAAAAAARPPANKSDENYTGSNWCETNRCPISGRQAGGQL